MDVKLCIKFAPLLEVMVHGVIGNTPVFGTVIQGSSPCGPTEFKLIPAFERAGILF